MLPGSDAWLQKGTQAVAVTCNRLAGTHDTAPTHASAAFVKSEVPHVPKHVCRCYAQRVARCNSAVCGRIAPMVRV